MICTEIHLSLTIMENMYWRTWLKTKYQNSPSWDANISGRNKDEVSKYLKISNSSNPGHILDPFFYNEKLEAHIPNSQHFDNRISFPPCCIRSPNGSTKDNPVLWQHRLFDSNTGLRASLPLSIPGLQSHIMSQHSSTGKANHLVQGDLHPGQSPAPLTK